MISIMIVDDEPLVRASVQAFLDWEEFGFSFVSEASDGMEALEVLGQYPVDLILLDIHMPRMDGLEFMEKLKGRSDAPEVIVLSANDHYSYVRKAFQLGAMDYILKSDMDEKTLLELLQKKKKDIGPSRQSPSALKPKDLNYLKRMLLADLCLNRNPDMTVKFLGDLGILPVCPLRICFLWLNTPVDEAGDEMIRRQASQFLKKQNLTGQIFTSGGGKFYFLLNAGEKAESALAAAESFCRDFIDIIRNGMDLIFDFALSSQCDSLEEIPSQYRYVTSLQTIESRMIRRAKKYLCRNFADPGLSLEEVSGHVEISKPHLSAQFKKETGMTFRDYLIKVRVEQAEKLLLSTNLKVYEISDRVGYPNVEHFSRIFKKITGMTPNRYISGRNK